MKTLQQFILESQETQEEKQKYEELFNELKELCEKSTKDDKYVDHIDGKFDGQWGNSYIQYIRFDALSPDKYPNNIAGNSIYIIFKVDLKSNKVEEHSCGHVYLSSSDLQTQRYKYLAMKSMKNVYIQGGNYDEENPKKNKPFIKQGFKTLENCKDKMKTYFDNVMKVMDEYCEPNKNWEFGKNWKEGKK